MGKEEWDELVWREAGEAWESLPEGMKMKTWAVVLLVVLGAGRGVVAQEVAGAAEGPKSGTTVTAANVSAPAWNHGEGSRENATGGEAGNGFAAPAGQPKGLTPDGDLQRWQVSIGPSFVRFHSSIFNASLAGVNTSVAWSKNEWLAVEGQVVAAYAPEIYGRDHVKYLSYGGGVRIGSHRARWEPFAHVLLGGAHLQPQTAGNSRNAFLVEAGGGADYRLTQRLSLRAEGDYVRTTFFKQSQNNFQAGIGAVFHF
jgi:opacity protein-like surface antigen